METTIVYWGNIGIMKNEMETRLMAVNEFLRAGLVGSAAADRQLMGAQRRFSKLSACWQGVAIACSSMSF